MHDHYQRANLLQHRVINCETPDRTSINNASEPYFLTWQILDNAIRVDINLKILNLFKK